MKYLYSTQPFLARCLNRFFYGGKHFVYAATSFYPYRSRNPKSSNPMSIYRDLYEPWRDRDEFDKFVAKTRDGLIRGVLARKRGAEADILSDICDRLDVVFFYPVVYRIDRRKVAGRRLIRQNSALRGSSEFLIEELDETIPEFDVLFLDYRGDADFNKLVELPIGESDRAIEILRGRCP